MNTKENILIHDNLSWFGRTKTIVYKQGLAIVELEYDNAEPRSAEISRLLVHETTRGKGIGNELLKIAEEIARQDGKQSITIYADKTHPDITLWYADNNYVIVDETKHQNKMIKNINTQQYEV